MELRYLKVALSVLFMGASWAKLKSFGPDLAAQKTYDVQVKTKEDLGQSGRVKRQAYGVSYLKHATQYVEDKFGYLEHTDYLVKKHIISKDGIGSVYLRQVVLGKEVFNANMNINLLTKNSKVLSVGNSFTKQKAFPENSKSFDKIAENFAEYLEIALKESGATYKNFDRQKVQIEAKLKGDIYEYQDDSNAVTDLKAHVGWLQLDDGNLEPVLSMDIQLSINEWFNAVVSIKTKKLISLSNWSNEVSYRIFPINQTDPEVGERQLLADPFDRVASPLGWHNDGTTEFNYTRGNNVYVKYSSNAQFVDMSDNNDNSAHAKENGNYDFNLNIYDEDYVEYRNASMTNLFYVSNMMHDILYKYGFDEESGNFQAKNFGKKGSGKDAVQAFVQSKLITNNAAFITPPDGSAPIMLMGLHNKTNPNRDSSLENSSIIHEYGHGLSTRLIGGAYNSNCLKELVSKGMGEGWSDMLAVMISMKPEFTRNQEFAMSPYYTNKPGGARPSKYSVSYSTNGVSFKTSQSLNIEHDIGHVWATMLYEVYWNLVDKLSFTPDWLGDGAENPNNYGNTLMLKIIIQSMKLMPCNPNFIDARDSMITAELAITNGDNRCEIWRGFAKRGLGVYANYTKDESTSSEFDSNKSGTFNTTSSSSTKAFENFEVPEDCNSDNALSELIVHN